MGLCFGFVGIPLSAELSEFWLCAYPSKCRGDCCLAKCLIPLSVEVIVVVPYLLCRGCFVGERSCVLLVVFVKSSMEVPCVGGPMWRYGENPSV